jgi:hypothetical protein
VTHSQVPGWTHLRVQLCVVAESWDSEGAPDFQHYRGVEGRARSLRIRLGRGTSRSSLNLHPKQTTKWLVHIPGHPWVLGQATGTLDHKTHHGSDSGEATTFPHIVFSATRFAEATSKWFFFQGLPSWNPEIVPVEVLGLWELITLDCQVWSQRGLNQSCSPRRDLSNAASHSKFGGREEVDSRLLVVGSQTASLTPGPSFAHNLGYRCPNGQCEAIFDIYSSRPFQWHQEPLNARCFGPCCRTLNIQESRRTPNPQLWECWASPPHLAKVGLRQVEAGMVVALASKNAEINSLSSSVESFNKQAKPGQKASWWPCRPGFDVHPQIASCLSYHIKSAIVSLLAVI